MTITTANDTVTSGRRTIGLLGAVSVGVGAIVGGGILALAGVAFASTGPSAIVAFGLNGVIALLTALSFAELSAAFPQSGGNVHLCQESAFSAGRHLWWAGWCGLRQLWRQCCMPLALAHLLLSLLSRCGKRIWAVPRRGSVRPGR
jgi:hypothetical protein